jgi:hypothetical protein
MLPVFRIATLKMSLSYYSQRRVILVCYGLWCRVWPFHYFGLCLAGMSTPLIWVGLPFSYRSYDNSEDEYSSMKMQYTVECRIQTMWNGGVTLPYHNFFSLVETTVMDRRLWDIFDGIFHFFGYNVHVISERSYCHVVCMAIEGVWIGE